MIGNFDFTSLETATLECEDCGWVGIGHETEKGYAQLPKAFEIFCPVCGNYFGIVKKTEGDET